MDSPIKLRNCILTGMTILIGIVTAVTALCMYIPQLNAITKTPIFTNAVTLGLLVSIVMLVATIFTNSHNLQRFAYILTSISLVASIVAISHISSSQLSVIASLVLAGGVIIASSKLGMNMKDTSFLYPTLVIGFVVVFASILLNIFLFDSTWIESLLHALILILFTGFTVYDANQFAVQRKCRFDCCEEVSSTYL